MEGQDQTAAAEPRASAAWQRNALLFIAGQSVTLFGSSVVQMAIIWRVALETSSGFWVTLLTLSSTLPQTLMTLFAGVWADRYPRKKLIILVDAAIALVTLLLALVLRFGIRADMLPLLILVSALRSFGAGIQTPAVSAVVPQIVPQPHLMRYNGLNGSMMSLVQFAAPAAAGALLHLGPFHRVLLLDLLTAIVGISLLAFTRIPHHRGVAFAEKESLFAAVKEGVSFALHDRIVGHTLFIFGIFIFLSVPSGFLTVLMIERTFGDSYIYLTLNEMVGFAGMVLGGLALSVWGGFKDRSRTLFVGLSAYGLFSLALGFASAFWLFALLMFLISFSIPVIQSAVVTVLQEQVPEDKQGRLFGLMSAIYSGFMPLGMALFGPLSDSFSIQTLVVVCGLVLSVLGPTLLLRRQAAEGKN